jgi:uncharacterized membrane protein
MSKFSLSTINLPKFKWPKCSLKGLNCKSCNLSKVCGVVSYLFILVLMPLLFCRKNSFVQFHAKQGLTLLFVWVVFSFSFYIAYLPFLFAVLILAWLIIGIINVAKGLERPLPLIGKLIK